jgi:hypothetical protein
VLVLPAKVGWREGKTWGSEEGRITGSGLFDCVAEEII